MNKLIRTLFLAVVFFVFTTALAYADAYQEGDKGEDVTAIQTQLAALGYNVGSADGSFGSLTTHAVKAFQRDRGLETDGIVGSATYKALMGREIQVSRSSAATGQLRNIVQDALKYRGVPYVFGGTTPGGFDCSGFVRYVFAANGVKLPRTADAQFEVGQAVSYRNLQVGDLVFFSTYEAGASHSGIYVGNGRFISATSSRGVVIDSLGSNYWSARYAGARRIVS